MILCCDASTDDSALAVAGAGGELLSASTIKRRRDLSVRLFADINAVLAQAEIAFDAIEALSVGLGPGSFTGVRVAVTTFRTLAQATGKKLIGVPTLRIYAEAAAGLVEPGDAILAVTPSRRGEVYAALACDGLEAAPPIAATYAELSEIVSAQTACRRVVVTGPEGVLPSEFDFLPFIRAASPDPGAFARLSAAAFAASEFQDPLGLNPIYVVPPAVNQHKDPRTALRLRGARPV